MNISFYLLTIIFISFEVLATTPKDSAISTLENTIKQAAYFDPLTLDNSSIREYGDLSEVNLKSKDSNDSSNGSSEKIDALIKSQKQRTIEDAKKICAVLNTVGTTENSSKNKDTSPKAITRQLYDTRLKLVRETSEIYNPSMRLADSISESLDCLNKAHKNDLPFQEAIVPTWMTEMIILPTTAENKEFTGANIALIESLRKIRKNDFARYNSIIGSLEASQKELESHCLKKQEARALDNNEVIAKDDNEFSDDSFKAPLRDQINDYIDTTKRRKSSFFSFGTSSAEKECLAHHKNHFLHMADALDSFLNTFKTSDSKNHVANLPANLIIAEKILETTKNQISTTNPKVDLVKKYRKIYDNTQFDSLYFFIKNAAFKLVTAAAKVELLESDIENRGKWCIPTITYHNKKGHCILKGGWHPNITKGKLVRNDVALSRINKDLPANMMVMGPNASGKTKAILLHPVAVRFANSGIVPADSLETEFYNKIILMIDKDASHPNFSKHQLELRSFGKVRKLTTEGNGKDLLMLICDEIFEGTLEAQARAAYKIFESIYDKENLTAELSSHFMALVEECRKTENYKFKITAPKVLAIGDNFENLYTLEDVSTPLKDSPWFSSSPEAEKFRLKYGKDLVKKTMSDALASLNLNAATA